MDHGSASLPDLPCLPAMPPACPPTPLPINPQPIQALILHIIIKQQATSNLVRTIDRHPLARVQLPYRCTAAIYGYGGGWVVVTYPASNLFNFPGHSPHNDWSQIVSELPAYMFQTQTMNGRERGAHSTDGNADTTVRHESVPSQQSIGFPIHS